MTQVNKKNIVAVFFLVFAHFALASDGYCCAEAKKNPSDFFSHSYEFPIGSKKKSESKIFLDSTINNISIRWKPPGTERFEKVYIRYKEEGGDFWQEGLPLWGDFRPIFPGNSERSGEYRGSILMVNSDTNYIVQLQTNTGEYAEGVIRTKKDRPLIKKIVEIDENFGDAIFIDEGGDVDGYILYKYKKPLDGHGLIDFGVYVKASYVVLDNFTIQNTRSHGIVVGEGVSNVYIDGANISLWGSSVDGYPVDMNSAILVQKNTKNIVIQNCNIGAPNTSSNSWEEKNFKGNHHPVGPQAISIFNSYGGNVIRNNYINAGQGKFFNDCIGGGDNFSIRGGPGPNSDIYNNYISGCLDDGIESEGSNENVRIYLNFIDKSFVMFGVSPTVTGPIYIFRNLTYRSQRSSKSVDGKGSLLKLQEKNIKGRDFGKGRVYFFNNTAINNNLRQGVSLGIHGSGSEIHNIHALNNVIDTGEVGRQIINVNSGVDNIVKSNFFSAVAYKDIVAASDGACLVLNSGSAAFGSGVYIPNISILNSDGNWNAGAVEENCQFVRFNRDTLSLD